MSKVIIFINDNGGISVVTPAPEAVEIYGLEAIALKDVPTGKPFKIVDADAVPLTIDPSALTDGLGGTFTSFE